MQGKHAERKARSRIAVYCIENLRQLMEDGYREIIVIGSPCGASAKDRYGRPYRHGRPVFYLEAGVLYEELPSRNRSLVMPHQIRKKIEPEDVPWEEFTAAQRRHIRKMTDAELEKFYE